jgi:glutamate 5-kinase
MERNQVLSQAKRIVIKLGTAVLMKDDGTVALSRFYSFVEAIAELNRAGKEILIVTSGAIGLGSQRLALEQRPKLLPLKQACAAIGQGKLMSLYADAFEKHGIITAQILLTQEDFSNRRRYLNLRNTISELLKFGVISVINENDTVAVAELEIVKGNRHHQLNFGDNDKLSSLVASEMDADLLIILTDVDGLYNADPRVNADAQLISVVAQITPEIEALAEDKESSPTSKLGRGGIKTKLAAAKVASQSSCATIIAGGKIPQIISRIFKGEELGTLFLPTSELRGKHRWIAFATTVKAALVVNEGARDALTKRKSSLLLAGVVEVRDNFERGDVVSILDPDEKEFARGIVNYSSIEAKKITGRHSNAIEELIENPNYDALITRDNIVFSGNN